MSAFFTQTKKDALQPNEREIDLGGYWEKIRVWVYGFLVFLLIIAACIWFYFQQQEKSREIESQAQSILTTAMDEPALHSLIEKYPETNAASQALMLLAFRKYQQQDWEAARKFYQQVYDRKNGDGEKGELRAAALFGIGIVYEAEKNFDKSLEAFSLLAKIFPDSFKAPEAKLGIARVHGLRGEYDKARQVCENIMVAYPQSQWKAEAENRLKMIGARAPTGK